MISEIVIPLLVGLALFVLGMKVMEFALYQWAGPMLKKTLERFTKTPIRGMYTGAILTAVLQSSSALTVITMGLINAGILTFPRTLGIILGANIGSCLTTELIGIPLDHTALPLLYGSASIWTLSTFAPSFVSRDTRNIRALFRFLSSSRYLALAICGFCLILLGLEVMQTIVPALQTRGLFIWFIEHVQRSLLWALVAGIVLTAVIQSSALAIAITMGLASMQALPVDAGIAIILGANIGTCSTAFMASIGGSKHGYYMAWSHIILNIGGALLFFPLIPWLQQISTLLSANASGQIAHAQTIFNITCSLLALPFCYLRIFRDPTP